MPVFYVVVARPKASEPAAGTNSISTPNSERISSARRLIQGSTPRGYAQRAEDEEPGRAYSQRDPQHLSCGEILLDDEAPGRKRQEKEQQRRQPKEGKRPVVAKKVRMAIPMR